MQLSLLVPVVGRVRVSLYLFLLLCSLLGPYHALKVTNEGLLNFHIFRESLIETLNPLLNSLWVLVILLALNVGQDGDNGNVRNRWFLKSTNEFPICEVQLPKPLDFIRGSLHHLFSVSQRTESKERISGTCDLGVEHSLTVIKHLVDLGKLLSIFGGVVFLHGFVVCAQVSHDRIRLPKAIFALGKGRDDMVGVDLQKFLCFVFSLHQIYILDFHLKFARSY
mmetsp:Transcript_21662/g.34229  ORF Transcript_21662/g.34229 Transcript_21662/m.34229 type:complete len:223 (+) Transcript_21662:51-719(+)